MQNIKVELTDGIAFYKVNVGDIFLYSNKPYIKLNNDYGGNCKNFGSAGLGSISKNTRVILPEEIIIK